MSKPSFTPGPWMVSRASDEYRIHDPDEYHIGSVSDFNGWPVNAANAALIAAAPDLLKELTHLAILLHPWIEAGNTVPGIATLNGAWAAIAKATGADA